jgi:histidyl-tRNA synthetase
MHSLSRLFIIAVSKGSRVKPIKPQLPTGMRDFLPADMLRRQYVINTIAAVFETYGYEPLQTPVLEMRETLLGKAGEDAEKLIFYAQHPGGKEELALRYDLTVPLARVFGMHEAQIALPFKRYQIAPVWRGERPQRGRLREFYQCDADIVGIAGMEADAESISLVAAALQKLGFDDFSIKISNRKLLTGIGQSVGLSGEPLASLYRSIDKLDKIGIEGVKESLIKDGITPEAVDKIMEMVLTGSNAPQRTGYAVGAAKIGALRETLENIPIAMEGLNELDSLLKHLDAMDVIGQFIEIDFSLVRGLGYYTGPIFEAVLHSDDPEERVGSVSGGGRYDNLLSMFRKDSLPVVGVSLGIERLIVLMDKRGMYPPGLNRTVVQVLVTVFSPETRPAAMQLVSQLRAGGIHAELYMQDSGKLGKQFGYASKKGIPLVAVMGPDEIAAAQVKLKLMASQQEVRVSRVQIVQEVQKHLQSVTEDPASNN